MTSETRTEGRNHDQVVVHEILWPGGWCDCGDGPFTRDQWLAHGGTPPQPVEPREPDPVPPTLVDAVLPVLSEVLVAYLAEFWPEREPKLTVEARADSIIHRLRERMAVR
jgi:hypothetical protein